MSTTTKNKIVCPEHLRPEFSAVFIPTPRNAQPDDLNKCQVRWSVTLVRKGQSLTTDYSTGIGYLNIKSDRNAYRTVNYPNAVRDTISGKFTGNFELKNPLQSPGLDDVLSCLLSDVSVLDAGTFEQWASDFGYDTDSRAAESIYRACVDIALKFRQLYSDRERSELSEAFQNS